MKTKPTLLVLAAGIGSRYGGLKQIDPVGSNGELIIDYSIFDACRAGFGKVVFVIRRDIEEIFKEAIGNTVAKALDVDYVYQELNQLPAGYALPAARQKPWGTAHAILSAKAFIQEPFGVINADDFYGADSYRKLSAFLAATGEGAIPEWALVGFILRHTLSNHGSVARGVCQCSPDGYLEHVTEHLKIEKQGDGALDTASGRLFHGGEYVSMNMWGFTPACFDMLEREFVNFLSQSLNDTKSEFQIPTIVDQQVQAGGARVRVLPTTDSWFGVTYTEDKPVVQQSIADLVRSGRYPSPLWKRT